MYMDIPRNDPELVEVEDEESRYSVANIEPAVLGQVDVGLLIEAIQQYPYLYDLSHKLYKDTKRKTLAWEQIGELLNCAVEDCIKAWKNIRDRFVRERNKLASGAAAPETNWPLYEAMLFYGKFTKPRRTCTSTKQSEGSRCPSRQSSESRPSSSGSAWSNITYDAIMSPPAESQAILSEEDIDAPGPSKRAEVDKTTTRKPGNVFDTPTTSSGYTRKRKRLREEENETTEIIGVAKSIMTELQTRQKNVNSTFTEYIYEELDKLSEDEAKRKRKKILQLLFEDD